MSRNLILVQAKGEGFLDPESNVYVSPNYPVVDFRNGFIETKINHNKAELVEDLPDTLWDEWLVLLRESNFVTEDALKNIRKSAPKKTKAELKAEEKEKEEAEKREAEVIKARNAEVEAAKLAEQKNSPDATEEKKAEKAEAAADKKAD